MPSADVVPLPNLPTVRANCNHETRCQLLTIVTGLLPFIEENNENGVSTLYTHLASVGKMLLVRRVY